MTKVCAKCGKRGAVADDQTDPGNDELALDSRGLVARNEYVCGECLEATEDAALCEHEWHKFGTVNGKNDVACQKCGAPQD